MCISCHVLNVLLQQLSNIRLPLHFQLLRAYFHRYIVVVIYYSNPQKSRHPAAAASSSFVHSMILALLSKRTLRYFFDCRNNSMPPGVNPGSECESEIHLVINTCAAVVGRQHRSKTYHNTYCYSPRGHTTPL